ncbi:hypothetical protein [Pseudomonas cannabina]|uniref:hypothetical protein n=1 Tax=Pseudomonas cannabina TaxID=86840 RepID=UPI0002092829|nr:hypothetical protein [Pseudomonas cannabina]
MTQRFAVARYCDDLSNDGEQLGMVWAFEVFKKQIQYLGFFRDRLKRFCITF